MFCFVYLDLNNIDIYKNDNWMFNYDKRIVCFLDTGAVYSLVDNETLFS